MNPLLPYSQCKSTPLKLLAIFIAFACTAACFSRTSHAQEGTFGSVKMVYSEAKGIGKDKVMRRDPSDIIKVADLYYVWYSKGPKSSGYDATVWYATSPDGHTWTEKGMAVGKGEVSSGAWDEASVFTPNILVAKGKYYLFFTGISANPVKRPDSQIGIAVADSPDGPWEKLASNPAIARGDDPQDFDSHLMDDACLIARDGKYWCYYKGRQLGKRVTQTQLGLAIADKPEGPYVKHLSNPIIPANHEVCVWPQGDGVAALIGKVGPKEWVKSLVYSEDGIHFAKTHDVEHVPHAAGAYRPEAFTESGNGERIEWGVHIGGGKLPCIQRFDLKENTGLKIYYIRHAQGGHNVKKAWQAKGVPESEWPAYVGDPDVFTPTGLKEVETGTQKLQKYDFDLVASSPLWRARNTVLPYLKARNQKAEVWPELREAKGMLTILDEGLPEVKEEILNKGKAIEIPESERDVFAVRPGAENNYAGVPKGSSDELKVAYTKHVSLATIKMIERRFGGSGKSVLLAGHNSSGVSLLKLLIQFEPTGEARRGLDNVGIWMVEQQKDGSYKLMMYNDKPYVYQPKEEPAKQ